MSDINEFNVATGEFVLRKFTKDELKQYNEDNNRQNVLITIDATQTFAEQLQSKIDQLMATGLSEVEAKKIAGV